MSPGSVAITALLILYPVFVYLGLSYSKVSAVAILLIVLSVGRLFIRRRGMDTLGPATIWISAGGILMAGAGLLRGSVESMLFYPTLVNLVLLIVFVHSLFYPPAVITRLARIRVPELPPAGVRYTRKVTMVWSGLILFLVISCKRTMMSTASILSRSRSSYSRASGVMSSFDISKSD